uniref:Uncharacterized protein n=2 Tax=Clytia hemisphaerica TaxID=252671 RepID=A0A7M5V1D4_9CNID
GTEVDYPIDVGPIKAGKATLRCMLLCWTGDYPAQCQIGKFSNKGTFGCRVDDCEGVSVEGSRTKYYTNNRQRYTEPWNKRNFVTEYDTMKDIEELPTPAEKSRRATETGYTGLSVLANLNFLYGFDVFHDLNRDVMHLVCLNLTRKLFKRIFSDENFDLEAFGNDLENFPFTSEMLDGHCPKKISKHNSWTAEEWQIFAYPVAEILFFGKVPEQEYHLVYLNARIVELLFHHRDGLKESEVQALRNICWRRLILLEEDVGESQCVITAHNSIHIADDLERFSHCDNVWCFNNERVVKRYKSLPTNCKNIEATYAKLEIKREILAVAEAFEKRVTYKVDRINGIVSSVEAAKKFLFSADCPLVFIGITSLTNVRIADDAIREAMTSLGRGDVDVYQLFRSCYLKKNNELLKDESFVFLNSGYVGKISEFIYVKNNNGSFKFARVQLFSFQHYINPQDIPTLDYTGRTAIVKMESVMRKVIAYCRNNETLFCIDYNKPNFYFPFEALP